MYMSLEHGFKRLLLNTRMVKIKLVTVKGPHKKEYPLSSPNIICWWKLHMKMALTQLAKHHYADWKNTDEDGIWLLISDD
jgi:hypothetical protein